MADVKPMNPLEMLAYVLARQINDHEVVYVGTGLPLVSAILAKKTHAPHITLVYESGGQDPLPGDMPWSVGGPMTWRKSPLIMEMSYSFGQCAMGLVDKGFLGFAQIDQFGNANTTMIGESYTDPAPRLTGSGGNNDVASLTDKIIFVGLQDRKKFKKKIDFMTTPGHLTGGDSRQKAGLLGKGPVAVVTTAGVYDFDPVTKAMRIKTLHPGVAPELAQLASEFEIIRPAGEIPVTDMPSPEVLEILRRDVDPRGVFITMP